MEMIIGGAFQGKEAFARKQYPELVWADGAALSLPELLKAQGVLGFQNFIRRELAEGREVTELAEQIWKENPSLIVVCDEVGYGVVPMDALDRKYREAVGRVCTRLAAQSTRVTRVVCGIGTVIKNA